MTKAEARVIKAAMRVHYHWAVKVNSMSNMQDLWIAISKQSKACEALSRSRRGGRR